MKRVLLLGALLLPLFVYGVVLAEKKDINKGADEKSAETHAASPEHAKKSEEAGNKICPVDNKAIDETNKFPCEYKGKIYNCCSAACCEEFKKNPKKYKALIKAEHKAEKDAEKAERKTEREGEKAERKSGAK